LPMPPAAPVTTTYLLFTTAPCKNVARADRKAQALCEIPIRATV
jgi:hypothetical protein